MDDAQPAIVNGQFHRSQTAVATAATMPHWDQISAIAIENQTESKKVKIMVGQLSLLARNIQTMRLRVLSRRAKVTSIRFIIGTP
jgi:hypothetical protein